MSDEDHYLNSYLSTALPELGLDPETYGPYVTGLFSLDAEEYVQDIDEEEMMQMLELLQSSSETHSDIEINDDEDNEWSRFRKELMQRRKDFLEQELEKKASKIQYSEV